VRIAPRFRHPEPDAISIGDRALSLDISQSGADGAASDETDPISRIG
jgi:hypothetical protein